MKAAMNKKDRIQGLFSDFKCQDFYATGQKVSFNCSEKDKCTVDQANEPIWTTYFGDENEKVMLVGEAPSTAGGLGAR